MSNCFRAVVCTVLFTFMFYNLPIQYMMISQGKRVTIGEHFYKSLKAGHYCKHITIHKVGSQLWKVCEI